MSFAGYFFDFIRRVSRSNILNWVLHGLFGFTMITGTAIIPEGEKTYIGAGLASSLIPSVAWPAGPPSQDRARRAVEQRLLSPPPVRRPSGRPRSGPLGQRGRCSSAASLLAPIGGSGQTLGVSEKPVDPVPGASSDSAAREPRPVLVMFRKEIGGRIRARRVESASPKANKPTPSTSPREPSRSGSRQLALGSDQRGQRALGSDQRASRGARLQSRVDRDGPDLIEVLWQSNAPDGRSLACCGSRLERVDERPDNLPCDVQTGAGTFCRSAPGSARSRRTGTIASRTAWSSQTARLLALLWARLDSNQGPTDYESAALTS